MNSQAETVSYKQHEFIKLVNSGHNLMNLYRLLILMLCFVFSQPIFTRHSCTGRYCWGAY